MTKQTLNVIFTICIFIVFVWAAVTALAFSRLAQFFPLYVSIAGSLVSGIYLVKEVAKIMKQKEKDSHPKVLIVKPIIYIGWIVGYVITISLVGLFVASTIYLIAFLLIESKFTFVKALYSTGIALVIITVLSNLLNIAWPQSVLLGL
ncbi:tripartite tricarboxylate transporter TctB family protein [Halobacillus aidingensis]|uniref:Tripartite tricarboxylate transporter TctB family protein n=1 Tax=Halobacillus aidingensis TaxID=240303 RepID=A0A1H0QKH6_HALAD|nr:tripartite tricarboxylate transporter TctB family protein [Halobacillus aidingensis]SDP17814.1 Tripartite tricarboxylate transporter TctB family protein [Halobacillus aidingensis]